MVLVSRSLESLTLFFPCHNEQGNVEPMVQKALEVGKSITDDYEVIVVNDGSVDDTAVIADKLAADNSHVRVIHHEVNKGYGGALQSGFRAASKAWIFYTDGDGQFDMGELPGLLDLTDKYDLITCYRKNRQDPMIRKLNAWAWGILVSLMFRLNIRDIDCAFKLYRREVVDSIEMHSTGALIDTEMLARAKRAGFAITQRGVTHYPRTAGQQSGGSIRVILRAFKELFKLRRDINQS